MFEEEFNENLLLFSPRFIQQREYWKKKLSGLPEDIGGTELSLGGPMGFASSENFEKIEISITDELSRRLLNLSNRTDLTIYIILLAGLKSLIYRYTGNNKIIVASPIYEFNISGETINHYLLTRDHIDEHITFKELLLNIRQTVFEAYENQDYPFDKLTEYLLAAEDIPIDQSVSYIQCCLKNIHDDKNIENLKISFNFSFYREEEQVKGKILYNANGYEKFYAEQISRHLVRMLENLAADVNTKVSAVPFLSKEEKEQLIYDFNDNKADFPADKTIYHFIEKYAQNSPDRAAISYNDNEITYRVFNQQANQLARILKEKGSRREEILGILLDRTPEMAASILAVWKTGGAYIPVDPQYPDQRILGILKDSSTRVLLTREEFLNGEIENVYKREIVRLEKKLSQVRKEPVLNLDLEINMNGLAYVIYTSGSTGKPKGAMIEHGGMMNHIQAKVNDLQINPGSIVAQNSPHTFDISVWQFFAALTRGGKTIIYPDQLVLEPLKFLSRLEKDQVTLLEVVPSYLELLLATRYFSGSRYLENLGYLLVTGEEVKPGLVKKAFAMLPGIKIVNAYGPTEASDDITHHIMDCAPGTARIPIGSTVQNLNIYVVDNHMNLCPLGVKGELVVSGIGVGRGYLNEVQKTIQSFKADPFLGKLGYRLYKTGDLALRNTRGMIEFLGRKDRQVKISGFRIELGEIESQLMANPGVKEAVVLVKDNGAAPGDTRQEHKQLCAYLVIDEKPDMPLIKEHLQENLPDYMVPAFFTEVDEIPLTPNGKVDRNALLAIEIEPGTEYNEPRTTLEKELAKIWGEVLEVEKVGINDNFFEIGGNSIKGIRAVNRIQEQLSEVIHVAAIFETPTIAGLAKKIESYRVDINRKVDAAVLAEFRRIINPLAPVKVPGHKNSPVLFILSPPRSGSTLLRVILAGHPELFAPPELELLSFNTLQDRKKILSGKFSYFREGTTRAIMELKKCGPEDAESIMKEFEDKGYTVKQFYQQLQQWLGGKLLVDKTPFYSLDIETLRRAEVYFDEPRYIHLLRDPYAVIHSFETVKIDQVFRYDQHFSARELAELVWLTSNQNINEFFTDIPADRKHMVKFEDLVQNPAVVSARICDFLGIRYQEKMIRVYENTENKMTGGIYPESRMLGDFNFFTHTKIDPCVLNKWKTDYKNDFLGDITIGLAKSFGYLKEEIASVYKGLEKAPELEYYELSPAQRRLWILHQLDESHIAYNIPVAYMVAGDLNTDILEKSYATVINRHETLRTTFVIVEGKPKQKTHDFETLGFKLEYIDLRSEKDHEKQVETRAIEEARTPFDLEQGPLLRSKLLHIDEKKYVFLFNMHHIISDGWSMRLLVSEILTLYMADANNRESLLPPVRFQYKDYSVWQNSEQMRVVLQHQEKYWLKEFEGEIPILNMPTDYPRSSTRSFAGNLKGFGLSGEETKALNERAISEGASLFMVLLAVYNIFLSKISSQEDIVVGTLTAGRNHPALEYIIGMFVNTLALRNYPGAEKTFSEFLKETKTKILEAYENQDYQFENLVDKVVKNRDTGRNPLFDVMFVMQNIETPGGDIEIPGLTLEPYAFEHTTSKFDLRLDCKERADDMIMVFEYSTGLFKEAAIKRFIGYTRKVISVVIENPGIKIGDIEIISGEEKEQIVYQFNDTGLGYPEDKPINELFAEQVEKTPDNIALISKGQGVGKGVIHITYRALNEKSNQLATVLRAKGVGADCIVGVMTYPSIEAVIAILSVLKAGGAFLPIDPAYPDTRKKFMVEDSQVKVLLIRAHLPGKNGDLSRFFSQANILAIDDETLYTGKKSNPKHVNNAKNIAYVIYTSGSTGNPKGVMVEQRNIVNYTWWAIEKYVGNDKDSFNVRVPLYTSLSFDLTITSIFTPLLSGNTVMMYKGGSREPLIEKIIADNQVEVVKLTPSHLKLILNQPIDQYKFRSAGNGIQSRIKRFIVGGEALETKLARRIVEKFKTGVVIYNEYGPTETAVGCMIYEYYPERDTRYSVPIGIPAGNVRVYILDKNSIPVPVGVAGELYISGAGVARGYLNNPELTNSKFQIEQVTGAYRRDRCKWNNQKLLRGVVRRAQSAKRKANNTIDTMRKAPCAMRLPTGRRRQKIYKTGDLARHLADGNVEFLGRNDHQVKIRGFRIEPGEIESKLMEYRKNKPNTIPGKNLKGIDLKTIHRCQRCLLSANYPGIGFDENGVCHICQEFEKYKKEVERYFKGKEDFHGLVEKTKETNRGKYDCLLLFSGGKDSTYVLYQLIDMGLKVLTFTFDNGYISDAAFENIKRTTSRLQVENIVCQAKHMNQVFVASLDSHHDVCSGCWHALNTFGAKVAGENGINLLISGLSRGQIFEMRLEGLFRQEIFDEEEVEQHLRLFRKTFHSRKNKFSRILDVELAEEVVENIHFVDFFRYFAVPAAEIKAYLAQKGWVRPGDTGFCSSNCMINDVGIDVHLNEHGYHFYAPQLSWDCRLGSITREEGLKEIAFEGDKQKVDRILKEIGYYNPAVKDVVVIDHLDNNGDRNLIAYLVSDKELVGSELRAYLSGQLPDYMIPSFFIQLEEIPLTPNGKPDRKALPGPELRIKEDYTAPRNELEKKLIKIWSEVLGIEENKISIHSDFFRLGGHSLNASAALLKIHKELQVKIPLAEMFKRQTTARLAEYIANAETSRYQSMPKVEEREYYPVSSAQKRMFLLNRIKGIHTTSDTIPKVMIVEGKLDKHYLEEVLKQLIKRHEPLRTSFEIRDEVILQRVHHENDLDFTVKEIQAREDEIDRIIEVFIRPFDLEKAPLFRVELVKLSETKHYLMYNLHHIITDGTSMGIFIRDIAYLYNGMKLPGLKIQYKDFSAWQNKQSQSTVIKRQEEYWLRVFPNNEEIPVLDMPTDFPRPPVQIFTGDYIQFRLSSHLTKEVRKIVSDTGATLYMVFLSIYNILLSKYSGQEDIVVGMPVQGRRHNDLEHLIGFFVNTLAIRNFPHNKKTFKELLNEVKINCLNALENQDYQFEELVSQLGIDPDPSRQTLFGTMLEHLDMGPPEIEAEYKNGDKENPGTVKNQRGGDLSFRPYEFKNPIIQFDLLLHILNFPDKIAFKLLYSVKLFKKETIENFARHFISIIQEAVSNPDNKISEIEMISSDQEEALLQSEQEKLNNLEIDFNF